MTTSIGGRSFDATFRALGIWFISDMVEKVGCGGLSEARVRREH